MPPDPTVVATPSKFVWFHVLNISVRNCKFAFSPILIFLKNPIFQLLVPGPRMVPTPAFPKCPNGGAVKASTLNHWSAGFGPSVETPATASGGVAKPLVGAEKDGVSAKP